jgi:hypothetical protein
MWSAGMPVKASIGIRITGRSQPTTVGVEASAEASRRTGAATRIRAIRASRASRQSAGGADTATRRMRATTRQPPISLAENSATPAAHATTTHGKARSHAASGALVKPAGAAGTEVAVPTARNVMGGAAARAARAAQASA